MDTPVIDVGSADAVELVRQPGVVDDIAVRVAEALQTYPYFVVLRGPAPTEDVSLTANVASAISQSSPRRWGIPVMGAKEVSYTRVQNNSDQAGKANGVTRYSRSTRALPLHTDSSYQAQPHELLAFQMVRTDPDGGATVVAPVEDVVAALDEETAALLRQPVYPFGKGRHAILLGPSDGTVIRYYREQLDLKAAQNGLAPEYHAAIDALDGVLEAQEAFFIEQVEPGATVFINNDKALHGRTAFSEKSERLMLRVRARAGCLATSRAPVIGSRIRGQALRRPGKKPLSRDLQLDLNIAYRRARSVPRDADARVRLAQFLVRAGRRDLAIRHLERAAAVEPENPVVRAALGIVLFWVGDFDRSLDQLSKCLDLAPGDPDALLYVAALCNAAGDARGGKEAQLQATRVRAISAPEALDPDLPTIVRFRAVTNSHLGVRWNDDSASYTRRIRDGHYSIKNLVDYGKWNIVVADLFGDNLLAHEDFPEADVYVNTVGCADLNPGDLQAMIRLVKYRGITNVINHPARLIETTRENNCIRLNKIDGVCFPQTEKFRLDAPPETVVRRLDQLGFTYPLLVRIPGTQTGESLTRLDDAEALAGHLAPLPRGLDLYAIQFRDMPDAKGLHHKTRAFFIDGQFYPVANLTSDHWEIHSPDRYRVMSSSEETQIHEQRYLNDPESYFGADTLKRFYKIYDVIGLDFFGIDFTITPEGEIFIYETNPAMRHNYDHIATFPYTEPHLRRISAAFQTMLENRVAKSRLVASA